MGCLLQAKNDSAKNLYLLHPGLLTSGNNPHLREKSTQIIWKQRASFRQALTSRNDFSNIENVTRIHNGNAVVKYSDHVFHESIRYADPSFSGHAYLPT